MLLASGDLDLPFGGGDGKALHQFQAYGPTDAADVALQTDGKLVGVGTTNLTRPGGPDFIITRFNTDRTPDATFGHLGAVRLNVALDDKAAAVAIQSDGKIVMAGTSSGAVVLVRLKVDGTPDGTFGNTGIAKFDQPFGFSTSDMALTKDGKIVVVGSGNLGFFVARYTSAGQLDSTFSGDGWDTQLFGAFASAQSVRAMQDGRIIVAGDTTEGLNGPRDFAAVRYTSAGTLDPTFDGDGKWTMDIAGDDDFASGVAVDGSGHIFLEGTITRAAGGMHEVGLVRLNADGSSPLIFDSIPLNYQYDGSFGTDVDVLSSGDLVAVGYETHGSGTMALRARFSSDGKLKSKSISDSIYTTTTAAHALADGSVIYAGSYLSNRDRYDSEMTLERDFADPNIQDIYIQTYFTYEVIVVDNDVQADGKGILFGLRRPGEFFLSRMLPDGSRDPSFGNGGIVTASLPEELRGDGGYDGDRYYHIYNAFKVQILPTGKILVCGSVNTLSDGIAGGALLARFNADGSIDNTFGVKGFAAAPIEQDDTSPFLMQIAPDGKIVLVGVYGERARAVWRFTADGQVDHSFADDGLFVSWDLPTGDYDPTAFAIAPDGSILIGAAPYYSSPDSYWLTRVTPAGKLDQTFGINGTVVSFARWGTETEPYIPANALGAMVVQPDGKILGALAYRSQGVALIRYLPNGDLDQTFGVDGIASANLGTMEPSQLLLQSDGRILVGGMYERTPGQWDLCIARFISTGAIDNSFGGNGFKSVDLAGDTDLLGKMKLSADGSRVTLVARADADTPNLNYYYAFADATYGAARFKLDPAGGKVSLSSDHTLLVEGTGGNDSLRLDGPVNGILTVKWNNQTIGLFSTTDIVKLIVRGLGGNDTITGSDLNERIEGGGGNDSINAGGGDDTIDGGTGGDLIKGGAGADTADYSKRTANLTIGIGTLADDGEAGEKDNVYADIEKIIGGSGNDRLSGSAGNNVLIGGKGNDTLLGNGGSDALFGQDGNDSLDGGAGDDYLDGGNNNDILRGGTGLDKMFGWDGNDTFYSLDNLKETLEGGLGQDKARRDAFDILHSVEGSIA